MENKNNNNKYIEWHDENENILKSWGDKAQCYQIIHDKSSKKYTTLNAWYTIPIIIFSTITGTGNFAQGSFVDNWKEQVIFIIGTINIISAILATIAQYLGVARKAESHRISSILWDKFSRKIRIELSKIRDDRIECNYFINYCQQEYDRLVETSPNISSDIIRWFRKFILYGENEKINKPCYLCCYEYICFPIGIECCNNELFNKDQQHVDIILPEIIGKIKATQVNNNSNSNNNEYNIYSV